jgi:hypothetical protein
MNIYEHCLQLRLLFRLWTKAGHTYEAFGAFYTNYTTQTTRLT